MNTKQKKNNTFKLRTMIDIKVFILYLLDHMRGDPVEESALISIVAENTETIVTEYKECLVELCEAGHLDYDTVDGLTYYQISPTGHQVAAQLYDKLDAGFLERGLVYAHKYLSLAGSGAEISSEIIETPDRRYRVVLTAKDARGEFFRTELLFTSRKEAEEIRNRFECQPDAVYRAFLFSASGKMDFLR